ncbi:collagen-like protein, partial [uncultured Clostridium sp.]|uniref:collagen-like protein n=3 Tax=uncultured Clostridium sp. TaxID=59620 RepID=UPI00350E49CD
GPQGEEGPVGPMGPQGIQGEMGPVGPQGPQGEEGPEGPRGPQGIQGIQGEMGPIGPTGPRGPQGIQGIQGERGPQGPIGPTGPMGPQGIQGIQGEMGPMGPIGPTGPMGPQGIQGIQGEVGPQGPIGPMGPQGPAGTIGDYGVVFREFGNAQTVSYADHVSFPENQITGDSINHIENTTDIELEGNKSYFVKYTVSYSTNECACGLSGYSKDIIFALTDLNNMIIPGSEHIASISRDVYANSISLGVIITPNEDYVVRLTNLTQDLRRVIVNAATVTIIRLA